MPIPAFDQWPTTESEFLQSVVLALRARSKSINYRVGDFNISVGPDPDQPEFLRLYLKMKSVGGRPDRIEVAIWDDGQLWLDARQPSKQGWVYEFSLVGCCDLHGAESVGDMIQSCMWIQNVDEMRRIWADCDIRVENSF